MSDAESSREFARRGAGVSFLAPHGMRAARGVPPFDVVAMAASLGGLEALSAVLAALPATFPAPIVIVQHLSARFPSHLAEILDARTALSVAWARPGRLLRSGSVYIAPPDQHLRVTSLRALRLTREPLVQFVRPSADVLFSSVASVYRERAIAVVLSGTRADGARGVLAVKRQGGRVLAQDAATAAAFDMPDAAIATGCVDFVLPPSTIAAALVALAMVPGAAALLRAPRARPLDRVPA